MDRRSCIQALGLATALALAGCGRLPATTTPSVNQSADRAAAGGYPGRLAITNGGSVTIDNRTFTPIRSITAGLACAMGDWIDANKTLYVADYCYDLGVVEEYVGRTTTPTFTYLGAGGCLSDTVNVTTDAKDNVYAVDDNGNGACGPYNVFEFPQQNNTPIAKCANGLPAGIALNAKGSVFVSSNATSLGGYIVEYPLGLAGCKGKTLGVRLSQAGGIQVANGNDLVVADPQAGAVLIIAPPYTKITRTLTGFTKPENVALNKRQTLLFVADSGAGLVWVVNYPSGTPVTALGPPNGATAPAGVATFPT